MNLVFILAWNRMEKRLMTSGLDAAGQANRLPAISFLRAGARRFNKQ